MTTTSQKPDLDSRQHIARFIDSFYQRLLADGRLAPIFLDVAAIDLAVHLPHIKDYWCKLLLGEKGYRRHTMNIHRQLHGRQPLQPGDFQRWLALFNATLDEHFAGEGTERARQVAATIAANMEASLASQAKLPQAPGASLQVRGAEPILEQHIPEDT